jgi:hypothetical protein
MTPIEKAIDALVAAKNGIEWFRDMHPEQDSEADDEMIDEIDAAIVGLRPMSNGDTYDSIWNALSRIDTAAVALPTFEVRHEGGIEEFTRNIVDAILAAAERLQKPMLDEAIARALITETWAWAVAGSEDPRNSAPPKEPPESYVESILCNVKQSHNIPKRLTVWYGSMPESNGRTNWTAILHRGDMSEGHTIDRSQYPGRVRYAADRVRFLLGELDKEPWILDYDGDERTPCHLCGGSGVKDGKPCWGLKFEGTVHDAPASARVPVVVDGRTEEEWCAEACRIGAYDYVEVIEGEKGRWIRTFTGERTPEKLTACIQSLKAQAQRYDQRAAP